MASISRTRSTDPSVFLLVGEAVPFVGVALLTAWRTRWRQAAVRHEGQIEFWVPAMSVSVTWDEALSAHRACRGDLGLAAVQDGEADVHRVDLVVACSPRSGLAGPAVNRASGVGARPQRPPALQTPPTRFHLARPDLAWRTRAGLGHVFPVRPLTLTVRSGSARTRTPGGTTATASRVPWRGPAGTRPVPSVPATSPTAAQIPRHLPQIIRTRLFPGDPVTAQHLNRQAKLSGQSGDAGNSAGTPRQPG